MAKPKAKKKAAKEPRKLPVQVSAIEEAFNESLKRFENVKGDMRRIGEANIILRFMSVQCPCKGEDRKCRYCKGSSMVRREYSKPA